MILRYCGSKSKLLPVLRPYLDEMLDGHGSFHDPFVGSGAVLLDVARRHPSLTLHANDKEAGLIEFWRAVSGKSVDGFCERIVATKPTLKLFDQIAASKPTKREEIAFRYYFLNRTSFSGMWRGGPIGGRGQRHEWKVDIEWRPEKSVREIEEANRLLQGRLTLNCMPGAAYVAANMKGPFYVDPPYFDGGDRLYAEKMTFPEHLELSRLLRKSRSWVLSLDDDPAVRQLYAWARVHEIPANYFLSVRTRRAVMQELVITPG
jgi:DNA adenine methylase